MIDVDSLINQDRVRELLQQGTGEGVRVAILDTGVDAEHPALEGAVAGCHEVTRAGRSFRCQPTDQGDPVGHGTACAGIIHSIAPQAELHSVRVMGRDAAGTLDQLLFGIAWAVDQDMDVINLSLGTVQKRSQDKLRELVDLAYFKGQIVVAAANNQGVVSYPAHFASLIAVDNEAFPDPNTFEYRLGQPIELVANGIYVKAPSPGGSYRLFTGTSFACPHVTGQVARLRSVIPDLTPFQAKNLLWSLRIKNEPEESPDGE